MTKDPVCGMLIDEHKAVAKAEHRRSRKVREVG